MKSSKHTNFNCSAFCSHFLLMLFRVCIPNLSSKNFFTWSFSSLRPTWMFVFKPSTKYLLPSLLYLNTWQQIFVSRAIFQAAYRVFFCFFAHLLLDHESSDRENFHVNFPFSIFCKKQAKLVDMFRFDMRNFPITSHKNVHKFRNGWNKVSLWNNLLWLRAFKIGFGKCAKIEKKIDKGDVCKWCHVRKGVGRKWRNFFYSQITY